MKAFLDSNVFLNPLLAESECHDCLRVLDGWRKCGRIDEAVTSYLSMANIAFVRSDNSKPAQLCQFHLKQYRGRI